MKNINEKKARNEESDVKRSSEIKLNPFPSLYAIMVFHFLKNARTIIRREHEFDHRKFPHPNERYSLGFQFAQLKAVKITMKHNKHTKIV